MPAHVHVTTCLRGGGPISNLCGCEHCCLAVCSVCGAWEGGLTTDCPGESYDIRRVYESDTADYTDALGWHDSVIPFMRRHINFRAIPARGQSVREITLANYQPGENHD